MTSSTTIEPKETKNLDIYDSPPLEWARVMTALDTTRERDYADSACLCSVILKEFLTDGRNRDIALAAIVASREAA